MAGKDKQVSAAAEALRGLADRSGDAEQREELLSVVKRIEGRIPRLAKASKEGLRPELLDRVQKIRIASGSDDFGQALRNGHLLLSALPGDDDPEPKFP
ncbi:MAG TPA: hypothetical protein VF650_09640 [Allosphingosinicella sp.]